MAEQIAVVGAGLMGQGIAAVLAAAGHRVVLHDHSDVLTDSLQQVGRRLDAMSTGTDAADVVVDDDLRSAVSTSMIVIEAVTEDLAIKQNILSRIDSAADPDVIISTNTSALPLAELRSCLGPLRPFIATHFFNPAEIVPGVEVATLDEVGEPAAQRLTALLAEAGKAPVRVAPAPGFIGNRLQLALFAEAERCVAEGLASPEAVDAVVRSTFGFRLPAYGPFQIADMAGLPVYKAILETLQDTYGDRFDVPASLEERTAAGRLGLKTGEGYYGYSREDQDRIVSERDATYRRLLDHTD